MIFIQPEQKQNLLKAKEVKSRLLHFYSPLHVNVCPVISPPLPPLPPHFPVSASLISSERCRLFWKSLFRQSSSDRRTTFTQRLVIDLRNK